MGCCATLNAHIHAGEARQARQGGGRHSNVCLAAEVDAKRPYAVYT